jgi:transposase
MIEPTLDRLPRQPERLVVDKAFDSGHVPRPHRGARGTYPIVPYRKRAVSTKYGDGRAMRRYKRRWKVERTFAWLGNFRRLVVRYERKHWIFRAFIHVACVPITLGQF